MKIRWSKTRTNRNC